MAYNVNILRVSSADQYTERNWLPGKTSPLQSAKRKESQREPAGTLQMIRSGSVRNAEKQ